MLSTIEKELKMVVMSEEPKKMRIVFVHDWAPDTLQMMTWKDGLARALKELADRGHTVEYFTVGKRNAVYDHPYVRMNVFEHDDDAPERSHRMVEAIKDWKPDVILSWADHTRMNAEALWATGIPVANCFAGGDPFGPTWQYFSHIFVESQSYLKAFQEKNLSVSVAFGTNTELFNPSHHYSQKRTKLFDAIFPGTFCSWKRQKLFAEACRGLSFVACGYKYEDHEQWCFEDVDEVGGLTLPHQTAEGLRDLYASSRVAIIPSRADGGSQRTVLEAMAMNLPVVVCSDSDKTSEYVKDAEALGFWTGEVVAPFADAVRAGFKACEGKESKGREYVKSKWSYLHYADALEAGLISIT